MYLLQLESKGEKYAMHAPSCIADKRGACQISIVILAGNMHESTYEVILTMIGILFVILARPSKFRGA